MIGLGAVASLLLTAQSSIPLEMKFLDVVFDELKGTQPADEALLLAGTDLCERMISSDGKASLPSGWSPMFQEDNFMSRREGVVVIYLEEDDESDAGCMILSKPGVSQSAVQSAMADHFKVAGTPSATDGQISIPVTIFAGKRFDYQVLKLDTPATATPANAGGLLIGVSPKEQN